MNPGQLTAGVLTVSDRASRGEQEDRSGPALIAVLERSGWRVLRQGIVPDDRSQIEETLVAWADSGELGLILTTGGTGLARRDVTPEATRAVLDREAPGISEAMRAAGRAKTPHAMLSRATAGSRGRALLINLPGSPRAAQENLEAVLSALPHALQVLAGDPEAERGHRAPEHRPRA